MPITNITHSACYIVEMGVSASDLTRITLDNNHTAYTHICLQGIGCVCVKNYPPEMMQPSSSTRATIVRAENQNDATIVKANFFFCHYYIVWESNNAGDARGQSWNESLKSRWIPGRSRGYTSGTNRKHFAALSSPRPWWRWLQLQPSCGSPQCISLIVGFVLLSGECWKQWKLGMDPLFYTVIMSNYGNRQFKVKCYVGTINISNNMCATVLCCVIISDHIQQDECILCYQPTTAIPAARISGHYD